MERMLSDVGVDETSIDQIAFVVNDLEQGMDRFIGLLGIEPWTVYRPEPPALTETTYRGEAVEYSMRTAIGYAGDMMIELIEPGTGPTVYHDHRSAENGGIHHVACLSWDEETAINAVDALKENGIDVIQRGNYAGTEFWYFDTASLMNGVLFEIVLRRNVEGRSPERTYP